MDRMQAGLRNAPKVLQRADEDMQCLSALFHRLQQTLAQSDEAIQAAHELAEGAIAVREKQLGHLRRHGRSARLPPIEERSSSSCQGQVVVTMRPPPVVVEEPDALRHILTCELQKNMDSIALDLQKGQVWLRVIREVLRGARRRVLY